MNSLIGRAGRLGDRLLALLVPATPAAASPGDNCKCVCSDACFFCCFAVDPQPGEPIGSCRVAKTGEC